MQGAWFSSPGREWGGNTGGGTKELGSQDLGWSVQQSWSLYANQLVYNSVIVMGRQDLTKGVGTFLNLNKSWRRTHAYETVWKEEDL